MVKRKTRARTRTVYRSVRSRARRAAGGISKNIILGSLGYAFLEPTLDAQLAKFNINLEDDLIKAGLGYYLAKKQKGAIQGGAIAMMSIGIRNIVTSGKLGMGLLGGK